MVRIDGIDKETHEKYRCGTDFEEVKQTLLELINRKEELGKSNPTIVVQTILFRHNADQIKEIKKWSKEIGADEYVTTPTSLGSGYLEEPKEELADEWLPEKEDYWRFQRDKDGFRRKSWGDCPWTYKAMVYWNGDITKCCYDFNGKLVFGNVFEQNFQECWGNEKHKRIIKSVLKNEPELCQVADCR